MINPITKRAQIFLILLCFFLATGIVLPALRLLETLLSADLTQALSPYNQSALSNTLTIGLAVSICSTILGFIVAYTISSTKAWGRSLLRVLFLAPIFAPSIMPAIGLIYLVGSNGLIFHSNLYGVTGVFLGALIFSIPHATLQALIALESLDQRLLDAARSLKAGGLKRLFTVVLSHCKNGLLNALLVTFVLTVTDFGIPKLLAGSFPMLATEIYAQAVEQQNFGIASFMSVWLLMPSLVAFYFIGKLKNENFVQTVAVSSVRPAIFRDCLMTALAWAIVGFELASILIVIYGSFITFWPYVPTLSLVNYSFENSTYGVRPWINSLIIALLVATIGTILSFAGAYIVNRVSRLPNLLKNSYSFLASLPICIPGTVLGLGFLFTFNDCEIFNSAVGSIALIVFNTFIHLFTVAHLTAKNTLSYINPRYELVGKSLGISVSKTIYRVVIPLSTSGLKEIFCFLFASTLTTISAVVFLYTPDSIVAAVAAIQMIDTGYVSEGAAMCTLIFASGLFVRILTLKLK